ncbi:MAG: TIGR00341 family protein [candidate division WS1 bacterium]|nr:TIGR00341 family protein [candidate division WS1 bacterium]
MSLFWERPHIRPKHRREIYEDVVDLSQPGASFYIMVTLATVIASYGLLIDSAAVVVGAMLVAPLMGPIFGIALAITAGSKRLLWSSLKSEFLGIALAIGVGVLIGIGPFRIPIGSELLVRTEPTLYDLAIALASGFAGAYALVDTRMSPALPGVAVAVAVLPPLAACGLTISAQRWEMAAGAAMLFIANFLAIQLAAAIVFSLFGMLRVERDRRGEQNEGAAIVQFLQRFGLSITALAVISWFMFQTLIGIVSDRNLDARIERTLSANVRSIVGARLDETRFHRGDERVEVTATVHTPRIIDADQVGDMEAQLEEAIDHEVRLTVRSLVARDMASSGAVYPEEESRPDEETLRDLERLNTATTVMNEHLRDVPGAELLDLHSRPSSNGVRLTALVWAPEAVRPDQVAVIEADLREKLDDEVSLVVRTVPIMAADSSQFIYDEPHESATAERAALLSTAGIVLRGWLQTNASEATVEAITVDALTPEPALTVLIVTPQPFTAEDVAAMQRELRATSGREIDLSVRYELGGLLQPPRG